MFKKEYNFYVYIMASLSGTLYVGLTNNLERRVFEHKHNLISGFTKKYSCHKLIYFEDFTDIYEAINREKQIKRWRLRKETKFNQNHKPQLEGFKLRMGVKGISPLEPAPSESS